MVLLLTNLDKIPGAFVVIFRSAFGLDAAAGGMLGAIFIAMQKGIARGIFSNEAGLGSAPIAAAAAQTKEPVRQGLVSMTGTFLDTIVVCTMTGLALVMTGAYQIPGLEGASVTTAAFQAGLPFIPPTVVSFVLMACLALFGFTTILGWDYYGERCLEYFSNGSMKAVKVYRWLYIAAVFIGPYMTVSAVWTIADIFNACMAVPNMIALIVLSGVVVRETKDFFKRLNDAGGKEEDMVPHKNHDDVPPIDSLTDRLGAKNRPGGPRSSCTRFTPPHSNCLPLMAGPDVSRETSGPYLFLRSEHLLADMPAIVFRTVTSHRHTWQEYHISATRSSVKRPVDHQEGATCN